MKSIFFLRIIAEQDILMDDKCKVWEILKSRMYKKITCLKNLSNENKYLCTYIYHNGANIMKAIYNFLKMFLRNVFFYSVNIFIYHSFYELSRGLKTIYS